jgi:hypothetical protein
MSNPAHLFGTIRKSFFQSPSYTTFDYISWENRFAYIKKTDLLKKTKFVFNLSKKICQYSQRPENLTKKDREATTLGGAGRNMTTLLLALKWDCSLSEKSIDKLAFWITRNKNSPMEYWNENKIFTRIRIRQEFGSIPLNLSASELLSFIFNKDRLPTEAEAKDLFLKKESLLEKERQ